MTRYIHVEGLGVVEATPKTIAMRDRMKGRDKKSRLQIMKDIEPYQSIIDGEVIGGRKQHRDHLRAHSCEEIGSEMPNWMKRNKERRNERELDRREV